MHLFLADKKFVIEYIYEQRVISIVTAHKIVPDDHSFSKINWRRVAKMLAREHKASLKNRRNN